MFGTIVEEEIRPESQRRQERLERSPVSGVVMPEPDAEWALPMARMPKDPRSEMETEEVIDEEMKESPMALAYAAPSIDSVPTPD